MHEMRKRKKQAVKKHKQKDDFLDWILAIDLEETGIQIR